MRLRTVVIRYRFEILLFLFYTLLAVVMTWPLAANFGNSIWGIKGDHLSQIWMDWWRKEALLSGESIWQTPLANVPFGWSLTEAPFPPLHLALRLGLALLTNEVLSFNIWFLLSFPLSGMGVYFLVGKLVPLRQGYGGRAWRLAAAFSGLIFAFSMYRFSHGWEHSSLVFTFWMVFYVYALVRFRDARSVKWAVAAATLYACVFLDNFYYGYLTFFFTLCFFLFTARRWLSWKSVRILFLFGVCCVLFIVPFVFSAIQSGLTGNAAETIDAGMFIRSLHDVNWMSARPWHYIIPSYWHPIWGKYAKALLDWIATKPPYFLTQPYTGKEHNLYLGFTALILAGVAALTSFRSLSSKFKIRSSKLKSKVQNSFLRSIAISSLESRSVSGQGNISSYIYLFLSLAIVMMVFSAPPFATLSGVKIYFPSYFLHQLFPMFRAYARFGVLVLLCVSVLAGVGLFKVLSYLSNLRCLSASPCLAGRRAAGGRPRRNAGETIVVAVLSALVLLEVWLPPFNVDLTPPPYVSWLAEQSGDFAIAFYPPLTDVTDFLYQRDHWKPVVDLSRGPTWDLLCDSDQKPCWVAHEAHDLREFSQELADLGVHYVIFSRGKPFDLLGMEKPVPLPADYLDRSGGFEAVKEFGDVIVYELKPSEN